MAATIQQHCATSTSTPTRANNAATNPNPKLKRLVYSKYRELLGSYNDQANAYIETLPSYMVQKDTGFNLNTTNSDFIINSSGQNGNATDNHQNEMYGAGHRMPAQQTYEAPACVQNAMMTKDKKPFTYTPGGIDLSQIKSERMAKRLARNAQAEGATGVQQQNRPTQPQSPGGSSPSAAVSMGAAAMGMPFQVLPPPPPPPAPGKNYNGGCATAPPPPPPSFSNFSNTGTLAAPCNGNGAGGRSSAPSSPSMPRKSPTPQRFEPPPMGFRPEIKIPPNPMAALRKVPPPVEKNTFWKDEYVKDRSKSPIVDLPNNGSNNNNSVNSASSLPQTLNATAILNNDNIDGNKKLMPTITTNNAIQQNQTNNNYANYQQPQHQQQTYTPPSPHQQIQQSPIKPIQQSPQYGTPQPTSTQQQQTQNSPCSPPTQQQQHNSARPEFRSVALPTSPAVNVYTRQPDSPRTVENATPPRATESPFRFSQQQQQQQRAPPAVSPLAQYSTPSSGSSGESVSPNNQAQTVPWRTQRGQSQQPQQVQPPVVAQSHPQPIYNNVQQQRTPDFSTQQSSYQGPKPTNIGSLYIAPLAPPTEPQAQNIVRQQMQRQQQQKRDSPIRQVPSQQQQQPSQQLRWMSTQPMAKEQPAWARPEENGNVVPSSLNRIKSPPPPSSSSPSQVQQQMHQTLNQGNGFMPQTVLVNFGVHQPINTTGLRLQINTPVYQTNSQNGPKERIIPIQLEQTPTYTPAQPSFNQQQQYGSGSIPPTPGYVVRTPNQFVDQGYNNFGQQQQQQQPQRVMSPNLQQLNAPRMVQQTQNNVTMGSKTHIIPIAIENDEGTRGPISKTPIVIQNDQRTPPVQSKSFRILQKITDTTDDGSNDDNLNQQQQHLQQQPNEPQLHRPTFARQMSAQQARHSPTVEQMRRMQIGHEPGNYSAPTTPSAITCNQQRQFYDNSQQYVPPSEQHVPEPKIYTGSAIPSRSFKILQAMTQPENAAKQENCPKNHNEMNEIESKPESIRHSSYTSTSSAIETAPSSSSTLINSDLAFSSPSPCSPTPPPSLAIPYPPYVYPYGYPWYLPPPPPHMSSNQNSVNCTPPNWNYPYSMHSAVPPPLPAPVSPAGEPSTHYPQFSYYYPYYPAPPPPAHIPPQCSTQHESNTQSTEYDSQTIYMPPPHPYLAYPYPVAPNCIHSSSSSRASSALPDIIITPSKDDGPSNVIMNHHIKIEKEHPKRDSNMELQDVASLKSTPPANGSVVNMLAQQLENMTKCIKNNLNTQYQCKKSYTKNIERKSPEDNTSPVQVAIMMTNSEKDTDQTFSDSEITPKQIDKKEPIALKSIKSVNNIQIYKGQRLQEMETELNSDTESEGDDDDETTADGESDIFDDDDEEEENNYQHEFELEEDSASEEFRVDDNLSVIYEEESEMEKIPAMANSVKQCEDSPFDDLQHKIEENDDEDVEEGDDSTSVTVRLPLKLSFSTSKDSENITTVEVGKSQIQEKRNSNSLNGKRNIFNVATVKSDSEDDDSSEYDDCDVSVTISLTHSSRSSSLDANVKNKNMAVLYPIENMPLPEESLKTIESSQEDVSVSFSLNMHNKFSNETNNGNITNNIAMSSDDVEETSKKELKKEAPDEMDFFATLIATKMQAQKIKEQSASYWGKSQDKSVDETAILEISKSNSHKNAKQSKANIGSKERKSARNTKTVTKMNDKSEESISAKKSSNISKPEDSSCNKTLSKKLENISAKPLEKSVKQKFSFWDRCSTPIQEKKDKVQETKCWEQPLEEKNKSIGECAKQSGNKLHKDSTKEIDNINVQLEKDVKSSSVNSRDKYFNSKETGTTAATTVTEEIEDIWADREEDLPPIKPIKSKLKSLETDKNSFWPSVYETEKQSKKKPENPSKQPETITKLDLNTNALRSSIEEVPQPQRASCHYEKEEEAEFEVLQQQECEEIDFWAEIERSRESKTPETTIPVFKDSLYTNLYRKQEITTDGSTLINSFGEHESSMFNDDNVLTCPQEFDPLKYPEEPREVDTDEEIDFWAEIEAKRQAEEDDVTFQKSASFWASRECHNSVDETPYKPVLPKAFHAKLPDEPAIGNINIWETLEAHKGEEPIIIDPEEEEEKLLVEEYDEMQQQEHSYETVSVHEPIIASVWCPRTPANQGESEQKHENSHDIKSNQNLESKPEKGELEIKRSNYRKAMAFFTTSIDENQEHSMDRYERGKSISNRSSYIEEEGEQWDWEAVNEALHKQEPVKNKEKTYEIAAQEEFVKEEKPVTYKKETCLTEDYMDPAMTRLSNGLPDLEVNKFNDEGKISVKDRISAFETGAVESSTAESRRNTIKKQSLSLDKDTRKSSLSRNSSTQRSESEMDEDDSGVTDMNKQLSETDTESESFPELRKMSSYQRASTHSRLFKLLQEDPDVADSNLNEDECQFKPSRKKIVHNVSITRKQNPSALAEAETMSQRRERLSLPLHKNTSIDNDNPSTPSSPASPIMDHTAKKPSLISDKLVCELVQSLLLKSDSTHFRNLPMEKLQAAAKRVLEEELDSLDTTSIDSTPAATPSEMKKDKSYFDYYNTWSDSLGAEEIMPSKSFRALHDSRRTPWTARCPRVLSSKKINRDLARVTESPEISMYNRQLRETSIGKWKKS